MHLSAPASPGGELFPDAKLDEKQLIEARRRAEVMVEGLGAMGLDAYLPGEKDLALGWPVMKEILSAARFPVVATNLADSSGHHPYLPFALRQAGGARVAIF